MVQGWVTVLLLAFGIGVGIAGVVAYLRLFRKERLAALSDSGTESPPSAAAVSSETDSGGQRLDDKSEQTSPED